jgi:membrane protease subunit (stomatin/prohibitin family)
MLKSLLKGISQGTGMGIGQELTATLLQTVLGKGGNNNGEQSIEIKCGGCGQINTADSKFCGECGTSFATRYNLQSGVKCNCGYMNAQGQKFCSECGTRL